MPETIVSPPVRKPRRTARQCKQAAFDLPPDLLEAIDAIADRAECSKSDVLTWLCQAGLDGNTLRAMRSALDPAPKHSRRGYAVRRVDFTELLALFLSEDVERK